LHFDKAYVIGFPNPKNDRLNRFYNSCEAAGVEAELFPAIEGNKIDLIPWIDAGYLTKDFQMNMPGSLGCLLSHVTLWEKIYHDPAVEIALICEDDALLHRNFLTKLNVIGWKEIPEDWDIIRLACHKITGERVSAHVLKPPNNYIKGANSGTYCYLINASRTLKLKQILTPYQNRKSMDVLLKTKSDQYHLYVLRTPLAREQRFRYSIRRDMNLMYSGGRFISRIENWITRRWFR